jgi:hypothetical protein
MRDLDFVHRHFATHLPGVQVSPPEPQTDPAASDGPWVFLSHDAVVQVTSSHDCGPFRVESEFLEEPEEARTALELLEILEHVLGVYGERKPRPVRGKANFEVTKPALLYLTLDWPDGGPQRKPVRMVSLHEVIPGYRRPAIHLDFNAEGDVMGIEILGEG